MNVQAQPYCKLYKEPAPVENYITGMMIVGTFITVQLTDQALYAKYAPVQNYRAYKNERAIVALTCIATTTITHFTIHHYR